MQSVIGERGQITIPKSARTQLGLQPGMALNVEVRDGALIVTKPSIEEVLDRWRGSADIGTMSTDEFIHEIRGPVE